LLLDRKPLVTITMDDGSKVIVELDPETAPNTVNNFIYLASHEFYNGTIFHRVIPNFMIQGGDPLGTGMGGPGYSIPGEFSANGFNNPLLHKRGVVSMARSPQSYDSAGSQFFIMVADVPDWDGQYATFGQVISGMETVDKIVALPRDPANNDRPDAPPVMQSVTVETFGATYPPPFIIQQ
jgi:peptidyl-prolyl cis-trans isomerase B (cyclophilin B)